jgi:hypothetical protein
MRSADRSNKGTGKARRKGGVLYPRIIAISTCLLAAIAPLRAAEPVRVYIVNEDSHPHEVAPGESTRFTLEAAAGGALMDVKCSLRGDGDKPLASVTLRTHGLTDIRWPFPGRSIRLARAVDFDIQARTLPGTGDRAWFEFVNRDASRLLWHQCYNN